MVQLRRESKGLVLDDVGVVQVRPLQRFYTAWQLRGVEKSALERVVVKAITEKR